MPCKDGISHLHGDHVRFDRGRLLFSFIHPSRRSHHRDDDDESVKKEKFFLGGNRELSFLFFEQRAEGGRRESSVLEIAMRTVSKRRAHIRTHAWKTTTTGKGGVCVCTIHNVASTFDLVRSEVTSTMAAY